MQLMNVPGSNVIHPNDAEALLIPPFFMDWLMLVHVMKVKKILLDVHGSYQKQTYRNRTYLMGANGRLTLNIPIIHDNKKGTWYFKDVRIDHEQPWQKDHLKTIKSAYNSSPYYEFYEFELHDLYNSKDEFLVDWNQRCLEWTLARLGWQKELKRTEQWSMSRTADELITAKKEYPQLPHYSQVFQEVHGFFPGMGFLDLLFNLGPTLTDFLIRTTEAVDG
jgi:hypothetical protein